MRRRQSRVGGFQLLEKREPLALSTGAEEDISLVRLDGSGRGIELAGLLDLVQSFGKASGSKQKSSFTVT